MHEGKGDNIIDGDAKSKKALKKQAKEAEKAAKKESRRALNVCIHLMSLD